MSKLTAAEASRQQQYRLAWKKHWLFCKLFVWYQPEVLRVKPAGTLRKPPAFDPSLREVVARADMEWTACTGLPRLDACDPDTWWTAAVAAGMEGQPVPNVRLLSARGLAEIIGPWAQAKMLATKDDPVAEKSIGNVIFRGDGVYEHEGGKIHLDGSEAFVLQALVELQACSKLDLEVRSAVHDAVRTLRRIREKYRVLRPHIVLPGGKGRGGYRTTIMNAAD